MEGTGAGAEGERRGSTGQTDRNRDGAVGGAPAPIAELTVGVRPQAYAFPSEPMARLCAYPAAIAVAVTPGGRLTTTGRWLSVVVLLPS